MKRKKTVLLILVLVLVMCGAAIWFLLHNTEEPEEDEEIYAVNYLRTQFSSVTVYNESGGYTFYADENSQYGYVCEECGNLPQLKANYVTVVDDVTCVQATYRYEGEDLSKYGLDSPRMQADVTLTDGTQYSIYVGDEAPTENFCYYTVSTDPQAVYVIKKSQFSYYKKTSFYFVDTLLAPKTESSRSTNDETDQADRISCTLEDGITYSITRYSSSYEDGAGQKYRYYQSSPVKGLVDSEAPSTYFSRIMQFCASSCEVKSPTDEQLKEYKLDNPELTISIGYGDEDAVMHLSEAPDGNYYCIKDGVDCIWLVADYLVTPWKDLTPRAMLSQYVLAPRMEDVSSVTVETYGESYTFEIKDGTGTCNGKAIDAELFEKFYTLCCSVNSVSGTGTEGTECVATITFTYSDGSSENVKLMDCGNRSLSIVLNGEKLSLSIREAYAETLAAACKAVIDGKEFSVNW